MKHIYVVVQDICYEGASFVGVFATEVEAMEQAERLNEKSHRDWIYEVAKVELGKIYLGIELDGLYL